MTLLSWFQENFLHLDKSLAHLIALYGVWIYAILFLIVFSETGLVIAPFLPGDALLFAIGAFAIANPEAGLSYSYSLLLLIVAAILGNIVNFFFGQKLGSKIFKEKALILKKEHLEKAHHFFEEYGAKALILARFLPLFRTLVPFVAGMAMMPRKAFLLYTIIGSILWVYLMMTAGLLFGRIEWVQHHFEAVVISVIFVSMIPVFYEGIKAFLKEKKAKKKL